MCKTGFQHIDRGISEAGAEIPGKWYGKNWRQKIPDIIFELWVTEEFGS
jgi:hypothetical protein